MTLNYDNLWKLLIDRRMTKTEMRKAAGISSVTLAKMSKGKPVGAIVLEKICRAMKCDVEQIIRYEANCHKVGKKTARGKNDGF